jgi:hypothetical protein
VGALKEWQIDPMQVVLALVWLVKHRLSLDWKGKTVEIFRDPGQDLAKLNSDCLAYFAAYVGQSVREVFSANKHFKPFLTVAH